MATVELAKQLRKAIKSKVWPALKELGFEDFTEMAAWRHQDQCIDCVMFQTHGPKYGIAHTLGRDEAGRALLETSATFSLSVGTYYTGVHIFPWLGPIPTRPLNSRGESSKNVTTHREISLARSIAMGKIDGTLFYVRTDGSNLDDMVDDALAAFLSRGLRWIEETRDVDEYISWGLNGKPFTPTARTPLKLSEEDQATFIKWLADHGMGSQVYFIGNNYPPDLPPGVRVAFEASLDKPQMKDHTAMDTAPYGEVLLGLLVSRGRWDEAVELQRRAADPAPLESRLAELEHSVRNSESMGSIHPDSRMQESEIKRFLARERKMGLLILVRQQELLDNLLILRDTTKA